MAEGENQDFVLFHLRAESLELVGAQVAKSSSSLIRIKIILKKGGEEVEHQEERGRRSVSAEPILQKKPTDRRFFVYFLGDIFFGNRRFVVHCFLAHRPKVMRMIYYLCQVLRRKKKMLNLCTIQIQ